MLKLLFSLIMPLSAGILFSTLFNPPYIQVIKFSYFIGSLLLSFSLFANSQEITPEIFLKNRSLILALTLGIAFKVIFLGFLLYIIFREPVVFLISGILAQIDPLFTNWAYRKFSNSGTFKLVLAESTFDDPMNTLLVLYVLVPLFFGTASNLTSYLLSLISNILFGILSWGVFRYLGFLKPEVYATILVFAFAFSGHFLASAISGLKIKVRKNLNSLVDAASGLSYFLLGVLLSFSRSGFAEGIIAGFLLFFLVRPLEVLLIYRHLNPLQKLLLFFSEQKGITSVLLALVLARYVNLSSQVIFGIITVNSLFLLANHVMSKVLLDFQKP